jgi:hypothetical protein
MRQTKERTTHTQSETQATLNYLRHEDRVLLFIFRLYLDEVFFFFVASFFVSPETVFGGGHFLGLARRAANS